MLTAEDLQQIRRIHIQLGRKVDSPFAGEYRSAFRGQGMEFEDVRPYYPGDDVRRIDWNVTARMNQPYIKEFREERELTLIIVADASASMSFDSHQKDKLKTMALLAVALSFAAIRSGDRVGLLRFSRKVETFLPPKKGRGHAWRVIREVFSTEGTGRGTNLREVIEKLKRTVKRRATICILSDFWSSNLSILCELSLRHRVHGFLIHSPTESGLKTGGLIDLYDAETGRMVLVDSSQFRPRFEIEDRLRQLRGYGLHMSDVSTTEDPITKLIHHFHRRTKR